MPKVSRRVIWFFVVLAVASPLLVMAVYVEDWSRDLTTNTAVTSESAGDPRLRPMLVRAERPAVVEACSALRRENAAWGEGQAKPLPDDSPLKGLAEDSTAIHLVRTTGLMRYRDDVWVVAEEASEGRLRVHAESRSRVGKGDLGQNPRNLRELLNFLRRRLGESDGTRTAAG